MPRPLTPASSRTELHTMAEGCFHCSEPLPANQPRRFHTLIGGEPRYFCCPACQAVAESIHQLGLDRYYTQRDEKPSQPATVSSLADASAFADMDTAESRALFVREEGDLCEAQLFVPDIHCASCCWLIEQRLSSLPGVTRAQTRLDNHKLLVNWQRDTLQPSNLLAALAQIGYRAQPWQPTQQQQHAQEQQQSMLRRLGVAGILAMQIHMIAMGDYFGADAGTQHWLNQIALLLSLPLWFYCASPFFTGALRNLKGLWAGLRSGNAEWLAAGMDLPVALAIIAAAAASLLAMWRGSNDLYFDSIAMFVFLLLGARYLETQARARLALQAQEPSLPGFCEILQADGSTRRSSISSLTAGATVVIGRGHIPVDGTVLAGTATVEQSAITGEFLPVNKQPGDTVLAGTVLVQGSLQAKATQWGHNSHIARLHQRMEQALARKPVDDAYARVAMWFTPAVLLIAAGSAIYWWQHNPAIALPAALAVLVASCPCALSLAIPAALTAATHHLRRHGVLVTGSHVLHLMPTIRAIAFDKTGTLTEGRMQILQAEAVGNRDLQDCLAIAAALEHTSTHPAGSAFQGVATSHVATQIKQVLHHGVEGDVDGQRYRLGKPGWACHKATNQPATDELTISLADHTAQQLATFTLGDRLRDDAPACVRTLQAQQVHCAILSGDGSAAVQQVAEQLGIRDVERDCDPAGKVEHIHRLRQQYGTVAMVGDGINDGPVLAHADISVALAEASHTAQRAADVVLLNNRLSDLLLLQDVARRTRRIARQNLAWALLYNISILPIAAAGLLPPVTAAFGMAISSLLVTLNALRLLKQ